MTCPSESDRLTVIEECARTLDKAAGEYRQLACQLEPGPDANHATQMAISFDLASDEIRKMNPAFAQLKERMNARVMAILTRVKNNKVST